MQAMRTVRSPGGVLALVVTVATLVRFLTATRFTVPWIAPDEMLYGLFGQSLWDDGTLSIRGMASPYYSLLTPALIGVGFLGRDTAGGIETAQFLQVAAMSSVAAPTYLWARRLASPWWAVVAAAIAVASPALTYGGLLMTEALFYPACTWALFAATAALERPTIARQGLFLLAVTVAASVRMQALALLPAFAIASWLFARIAPGEGRLAPLAPLGLGIVALSGAVGITFLVAPDVLGSTDLLGGYAALGETTAVGSNVLATLAWHLGAVVVVSSTIPALVTTVLAFETFRGRTAVRSTQAFVAIATAYVLLLVVQVSVFAGDRLAHIPQRYLVTAMPLLAVGLTAWVGAGAPRPRRLTLLLGALLVMLVALVPIGQLVPRTAIHDALFTTALLQFDDGIARACVVASAVIGVALVILIPKNLLWVPALVVVAVLVAASAEATRVVTDLSAREERAARGDVPRDWLDREASAPVSLLVTGERAWPVESRTVFWNTSVREVMALPGVGGGVPPGPTPVTIDELEGWVRGADGVALERDLVAAPRTIAFDGVRLAEMPQTAADSPGLGVWKTARPLRVASMVLGVLPNGDFSGRIDVVVPGCVQGALEVTLIGKSGDPIRVLVNGVAHEAVSAPAGETPTATIPAPGYADGSRPCSFVLETDGYVGTTRIAYVPGEG